jgi:hypothetical protein
LSEIITGYEHGAFNMILQENKKKIAMVTVDIPTTQESLHVKITNEDTVHQFLQY